MDKVKLVRKIDTKSFMEGDEYCRSYFDYDKIVFGTSELQPGRKGAIDPGHKDAYEVFFVSQGRVLVHFPDEDLYEELDEGDAILVPPPRPHELVNIGEKTAVVVWSQARLTLRKE